MSTYTDRVARMLEGLEAVSTGLCPGCDECRADYSDYIPQEDDSSELPEGWAEIWTVPILQDKSFPSEEGAERAARECFAEDCGNGTIEGEPSFSWSECDICGSRLGGDREVYHYWHGGKLRHDFGACVDCVVYLANGTEPERDDGPELP